MSDDHFQSEELVAFIDGDLTMSESQQEHLTWCASCRAESDELKTWMQFLERVPVWDATSRSRHVAEAAAFAALREREKQEAETARAFIQSLGPDFHVWRAAIEPRRERHTPALVRALIDETRARYSKTPRASLHILHIAAAILRSFRPPAIRLEGDVYREYGNAFRFVGRYTQALNALARAEACYRNFLASDYDLAFVDWGRASVLFDLQRYRVARACAERARTVFADHGDDASTSQVDVLRASILFDEGDIAAARDAFHAVLPTLRGLGDDTSVARVEANLAGCEVRLGNTASAKKHAQIAIASYEKLGMVSEAVRLHWSLAGMLKDRGEIDEALAALRRATARFQALGMAGDAAAVALETIELLEARGETADAAGTARELMSYFQSVGAHAAAAEAFASLQRALLRSDNVPFALQTTADLVRCLRDADADARDTLSE